MKIIHAKFKGYCATCHYTIWLNEIIKYDGKARHVDCVEALKDPTPRIIHPKYAGIQGVIDKDKFAKAVKGRKKKKYKSKRHERTPQRGRVGFVS